MMRQGVGPRRTAALDSTPPTPPLHPVRYHCLSACACARARPRCLLLLAASCVWFLLGDLFSRRVAATYKGLTLCFGSLCVCSLLAVQVVQVTSGLAGPARAQPSQQRPPQDHPAEATHPSRSLARGAPAGTWEALTTRRHPLGRSTAYVAHSPLLQRPCEALKQGTFIATRLNVHVAAGCAGVWWWAAVARQCRPAQ